MPPIRCNILLIGFLGIFIGCSRASGGLATVSPTGPLGFEMVDDGKVILHTDAIGWRDPTPCETENRGTAFDQGMTRIVEAGSAPVMVEPVVGIITFHTTAKKLSAWPLAPNGIRQKEIPIRITNSQATFAMQAADETVFYEIAAQ